MKIASKRPASVTWLLVGVLTFTGLQSLRLATALADWVFLTGLGVPVMYLAASALFWAGAGLLLLWGLWQRRPWLPQASRLAVVVYALYYWLDRLWIAADGSQSANWLFALILTVSVLAWIFALFSLARVRAFFGVADERTRQD